MKNFLSCLLILVCCFLFASPVLAEKQQIYYVIVNFDQGNVKIGDVSVGNGYVPGENEVDDQQVNYWLELISFEGRTLEVKQFNVHLQISFEPPSEEDTYDRGDSSTLVNLDKQEEAIIIPYHKDGYLLNLYDSNRNLLETKDIAYLADLCGDGVCQEQESYESCKSDCPLDGKDDYCNLEKINEDPDCAPMLAVQKRNNQTNASEKSSKNLIFLVAGVLLFIIFLIIAIIYYIKRKKRSSGDNEKIEYSQPKDLK